MRLVAGQTLQALQERTYQKGQAPQLLTCPAFRAQILRKRRRKRLLQQRQQARSCATGILKRRRSRPYLLGVRAVRFTSSEGCRRFEGRQRRGQCEGITETSGICCREEHLESFLYHVQCRHVLKESRAASFLALGSFRWCAGERSQRPGGPRAMPLGRFGVQGSRRRCRESRCPLG